MGHRVLRLPANTAGRDFVIGDVHGAYDLVLDAMRAVGFDHESDRLFCVGDLVDRGKDSWRVEQFLQQPFVYAVRGNHDHLVAGCEADMVLPLATVNFNGMRWLKDVPAERVQRIQKALDELPFAIEIASADGSLPTGIVHAQVPQNWAWPDLLQALGEWPVNDGLFEDVLTSRLKFDCCDASRVLGVKRVFVGHCISWDGPKVLGNTVYADTGAIYAGREKGASLSIIETAASDAEIEGCELSEQHPGLRICRAASEAELEGQRDGSKDGAQFPRERVRSGSHPAP